MAGAGRWMKTYGETVYGTRAGEIAPGAWGVSTRKGDRLFVHVLRRDGDTYKVLDMQNTGDKKDE